MAKGFFSGAIVATVLATGGLATLSVMETNRTNRLIEDIQNMANQPTVEPSAADSGLQSSVAEDGVAEVKTPEASDSPTQTAVAGPAQPDDAETPPTVASETAQAPDVSDTASGVPKVEDIASTVPELAASNDEAPTSSEAPALNAPIAGTDATPDTVDAPSLPAPQTGDVVASLIAPQEPSTALPPASSAATTENATPVVSPSLSVPNADTAPDASGLTAKPTPEASDSVAALAVPETSSEPTPIAAGTDTGTRQTAGEPATLTAPEADQSLSVSTEPAAPPVIATPEEDVVQSPAGEPSQQTASESAPTAQPRPRVRVLVPDREANETDDTVVETAALNRPAIGKPANSLIDRNARASTLPTIGQGAGTTEEPASGSSDDSLPPRQRYAADVADVDASLPKMAIVLIDDGKGPMGPNALDNFPFPVTFAMDPTQPEAAGRMSAYRSLGYEVATLANLPDGAQPTDVEQLLAGALAAVPEAVALVQDPTSGAQSDRPVTEQIARYAADSGHGLVFMPNGLNTAEALARRENVPAISVHRDFDGEGQDARTKRRFLDGAAFRARQQGEVVMLGRLTPDTVSALLLWSLQDRASSVAMVPVSYILNDTSG